MASGHSELIDYPIARHDDLTVDDFYRELQRQGPIKVRLPYGEPCWLATAYDDVKTVYGDRRFGRQLGAGRDTPRLTPMRFADDPSIIANMDPPKHTRLRRLTLTAFSAARIRDLHGWVVGLVDDVLDEMAKAAPPVDFVAMFSWTLPLRIITGILGVAEAEVPTFRGWVDKLMAIDVEQADKDRCRDELLAYIRGLIAERRVRSTDDLLSVMVHARDEGDQLTEEELISLSMALFLAGFETTAAQLASTFYTLMSNRHLWQELLDDQRLMPAALDELWRWIPSFRFGMPNVRWANEDVELSSGVLVAAGDPILPEHQVANRDESAFPRARELDFHRVNPQPHLSLAFGAHRCLGAHLAHLEIESSLARVLERFPTLQLAVGADDVKWSSSTFLRSPAALPLTW